MPLVHIALRAGKTAIYRESILDGIYGAMREALNVPEDDQFMFITEHEQSNFRYGKSYLDIARSDGLIYIQITVFNTRTVEQKKLLYRRIVELLAGNPGVREEDLFINVLKIGPWAGALRSLHDRHQTKFNEGSARAGVGSRSDQGNYF